MKRYVRLGINIDHVATLRNARGENYPKVTEAARIVENSGADLVTVHLREDRRHINEKDLGDILDTVNIPVNLEIGANSEMVKTAIEYKPQYVCLVPEKRQEITTEGGLDVINNFDKLKTILKSLFNNNINVAVFIDPDKDQLIATQKLGLKTIEFHTGTYANAFIKNNNVELELKKITESTIFAKKLGLNCHAGHGLTYNNVRSIVSINNIVELNIGHFIIANSIFDGLENSILKMRNIISEAIK
jgi:pyridoxine 5-phosphate synthase